jgi:hypothetical protein
MQNLTLLSYSALDPQRNVSSIASKNLFAQPAVSAPFVNGIPTLARSFHATTRVDKSATPAISDAEVTGLFKLWNDALATLDPDTVAKRYAKTSVLLPTVSDTPRTDYNGIKSYFVDFLQKKVRFGVRTCEWWER